MTSEKYSVLSHLEEIYEKNAAAVVHGSMFDLAEAIDEKGISATLNTYSNEGRSVVSVSVFIVRESNGSIRRFGCRSDDPQGIEDCFFAVEHDGDPPPDIGEDVMLVAHIGV